MWGKFSHWLSKNHVRLHECQSHHIGQFLENELPNKVRLLGKTKSEREKLMTERKAHRQRYVRLIEKTYAHLADLGLEIANPGRDAGLSKMGAGNNAPTKFLDPEEIERLIAVVENFLTWSVPEDSLTHGIEFSRQWATARDIALSGVMIGSGLRVEEIIRLTVNCTIGAATPGEEGGQGLNRLTILPAPGKPGRQALCFPVAEMALAGWLKWRPLMPCRQKTDLLFPADVSQRRHDLPVEQASMHPSSLFRRVSKVLTAAGISGNRVGGQTLRNTYAALLVEAGSNDMEIMESMGLQTAISVFRLREKLKLHRLDDSTHS